METKHINDRLDPSAEYLDGANGRAMGDAALKDVATASVVTLPDTVPPLRSEFVINPLSRRLVPYWRRRR